MTYENLSSYLFHLRNSQTNFNNYIDLLTLQEQNLSTILSLRRRTENRSSSNSYVSNTYTSNPLTSNPLTSNPFTSNPFTSNVYTPQRQTSNNRNLYSAIYNTRNQSRLSAVEISYSTYTTNYSDIQNPMNSSCPITFQQFDSSQNVMVINHCRHIFNERSLRSWFTYNTRCPLCRHNLRASVSDPSSNMMSEISQTEIPTPAEEEESSDSPRYTTIYENDGDAQMILSDISGNTQSIINNWNENVLNEVTRLLNDDISGNIRLEYRLYSG